MTRKNKTRRGRLGAALVGGMVSLSLLAGCGGGGGEATMPESYGAEGEEVPALNQAVGLFDVQYSQQSDSETGSSTYTYGGLAETGQMVSDYVTILEDDQGFSVITEDGTITDAPDFTAQSGSVTMGKNEEGGEGALELAISWDENSCTVTYSLQSDLQVRQPSQPQPLTMEEAVDLLKSQSTQKLGLEGDIGDYSFYPEEGLVGVDGQMCLTVNAYYSDDAQIAGTYLVAQANGTVYRLDRQTNQVARLV